jgi:glycosyltransferase involved in cell wall biosynthesis
VDLSRGIGGVAHSEACRKDMIQLGLASDEVVLARPGVSLKRYTPLQDKNSARKRCGLPQDKALVAYVGNIQLFKGMADLLRIAKRVPQADFVVVGGSAAQVDDLRREANGLGVTNLITTGHKPAGAVAEYLFAADVLFQPATFGNEAPSALLRRLVRPRLPGVPFKLFSYMAAGRPTVAADQAINTELLIEGENALLYKPGDDDRAVAAVQSLLHDPDHSERLAKTARITAEQYTWEKRARIMLSFFERRLKTLDSGRS